MYPAHYSDVLKETHEGLAPALQREQSSERNRAGYHTASVSDKYRRIGAIGYLIEKDAEAFRANLIAATRYRMKLFDRFDAGDPIAKSFVTMFNYKELLDALASGDMDIAREFASKMGGRGEAELKNDRPFETAMGYGLKALVAGDDAAALEWFQSLEKACTHKDYVNFAGYVPFLRAIAERDSKAAEAALPAMLAGHKRECKRTGMHNGMEDEFIFVWGIGLINLALSRGMDITVQNPLIPNELITP